MKGGCELLSKVDIFDIRNNISYPECLNEGVVNCSQKLISLIFGTTSFAKTVTERGLWIALKSWYLWYSEQPQHLDSRSFSCCELLSKVDIFDIRNNRIKWLSTASIVVNCSQKLISLIFGTTQGVVVNTNLWLWIALKSWYLWYSEQPTVQGWQLLLVVNCSQKLISLIFGTTPGSRSQYQSLLWIALKSWYLWYSEQQSYKRLHHGTSCELLSKVDIFDIRNNRW